MRVNRPAMTAEMLWRADRPVLASPAWAGWLVAGGHAVQPGPVRGIKVNKITGAPDPEHIATSDIERQNLTIRMSMRRFTHLTNAFSKKLENLTAALSLHFMYYNFAWPHQTLTKWAGGTKTTPAMAAGLPITSAQSVHGHARSRSDDFPHQARPR